MIYKLKFLNYIISNVKFKQWWNISFSQGSVATSWATTVTYRPFYGLTDMPPTFLRKIDENIDHDFQARLGDVISVLRRYIKTPKRCWTGAKETAKSQLLRKHKNNIIWKTNRMDRSKNKLELNQGSNGETRSLTEQKSITKKYLNLFRKTKLSSSKIIELLPSKTRNLRML